MFGLFKDKKKTCFVCDKALTSNPASISYYALNDNNEPQEYSQYICDECEEMMEKMNEFFDQRDETESLRLRKGNPTIEESSD